MLVSMLLLAACSKSAQEGGGGPDSPGGGQMPPAEVTVVTLKTEKIALQTELPGRTTASLASEVRPQISGIVKARTFEEGARVKAGQVLYQIDPAQYRAALAGAEADLANAKAMLESAKIRDDRFAGLVKIEGVSKQEADDARLSHSAAVASVSQKEAAVELARINLDYTAIKAPMAAIHAVRRPIARPHLTENRGDARIEMRTGCPIQ